MVALQALVKRGIIKANAKKLTDEQKKAIAVGVGVTAAVAIAAVGGVALYKNGKLNPVIERLKEQGIDQVHLGSEVSKFTDDIKDGSIGIENKIVKIDGNTELQAKYEKFGFPEINETSQVVSKIMEDCNKNLYNSNIITAQENCKENSLTFFMRKGLGKDLVSPLPDGNADLENFCCTYFEYPFQSRPTVINGEKRYIRKSKITSDIKIGQAERKIDGVKKWIQDQKN